MYFVEILQLGQSRHRKVHRVLLIHARLQLCALCNCYLMLCACALRFGNCSPRHHWRLRLLSIPHSECNYSPCLTMTDLLQRQPKCNNRPSIVTETYYNGILSTMADLSQGQLKIKRHIMQLVFFWTGNTY